MATQTWFNEDREVVENSALLATRWVPRRGSTGQNLEDMVLECATGRIESYFGVSAEELVTRGVAPYAAALPQDRERVWQHANKALADRSCTRITPMPFRARTTDRRVIWVEDHITVTRDREGHVVRLTAISNDVTRREDAVRALERSNKRLRVFESLAMYLNGGDEERVVEEGLRLALELTDSTSGSLRAANEIEIYMRVGEQKPEPERVACFAGSSEPRLELTVQRGRPYDDEDRRGLKLLADATWALLSRQQSGVERESSDALRATSERRFTTLGRLLGGVVHDFNNVLTVIGTCSEFLEEELETLGGSTRGARAIRDAVDRAAGLTRKLLKFDRTETEAAADPNLSEVVLATEPLLNRLLPENHTLDVDLPIDPLFVRCSRGDIERILVNLVCNARDSMPSTGVVAVSVRSDNRHAELTVRDTGIGMSESLQRRIFEPYFTTKTEERGTGLGLSVVAELVRAASGSIHVDSSPAQGTRFTVRLPRVFAPREVTSRDVVCLQGGDETILVAEDDTQVREAARRVLSRYGYRVLTAANGGDAIRLFEAHADEVDLVVSDVVMPGGNGPEVESAVHERRPSVPVVFVSGYTDEELGDAVAVIRKPFSRASLLSLVRTALDHGATN